MNSGIKYREEKLKQIKSEIGFKNVKSNIILKKIFDVIKKDNLLKIMKYNKALQKRLNLSLNDYKEYSRLYTPIEIELKLDQNKKNERIEFINLPDEGAEYYHIYFDNSNEEIQKNYRNYLNKDEKVNTIRIIFDYQIKSFKGLFSYCKYINSIFFKKFNRIDITNMSSMFYGCSSLKELNLSNFNTNNVTNMDYMFYGCSSLKELNLSNFNTNNISNMSCMFKECLSLKKIKSLQF